MGTICIVDLNSLKNLILSYRKELFSRSVIEQYICEYCTKNLAVATQSHSMPIYPEYGFNEEYSEFVKFAAGIGLDLFIYINPEYITSCNDDVISFYLTEDYSLIYGNDYAIRSYQRKNCSIS